MSGYRGIPEVVWLTVKTALRTGKPARELEGIMGLLVDGHWQDQWYDTRSSVAALCEGNQPSRNWVTPDGSPGPSGVGGFKAEPGRYHSTSLSPAQWAHRTLIFRQAQGAYGHDWLVYRALAYAGKTAGRSWTGRVSFRILSMALAFSTRS